MYNFVLSENKFVKKVRVLDLDRNDGVQEESLH